MGNVSVIATVGEDPGWSPEERERYKVLRALGAELRGLEERSGKVARRLAAARQRGDEPRIALYEVKAMDLERRIAEAQRKVANA